MNFMFLIRWIPPKILSAQARKPRGFLGRYLMKNIFINNNADLNAFIKENLGLKSNDHVLEIGFGPGRLIHAMAKTVSEGVIEGIDFSRVMHEEASAFNQESIASGKVQLHSGNCESLPFLDQTFHKLCSANTLYFWKDPLPYFQEMYRVLKPGGSLVIGFRDDEQMKPLRLDRTVFNTYTQDEVKNLLSRVGFQEIDIKSKIGKPFDSLCAVGTRQNQ